MRKFSTHTLPAFILTLVIPITVLAQTDDAQNSRSTLTPEAEAYYVSLIPKKDTTFSSIALNSRKNSFWKRTVSGNDGAYTPTLLTGH